MMVQVVYQKILLLLQKTPPPTTIVSGGGNICEDGSTVTVHFSFNGNEIPWDLTYSDGTSLFNQYGI